MVLTEIYFISYQLYIYFWMRICVSCMQTSLLSKYNK